MAPGGSSMDWIPILFAMISILLFILPLPRKIKGWDVVSKKLIEAHAVCPTQAELRAQVKKILPSEPLTYSQPTALVELKFRFGMRPQIAWAFLIQEDIICLRWIGENPYFRNSFKRWICSVVLPRKISSLLRDDIFFLRQKHEIVSEISTVD